MKKAISLIIIITILFSFSCCSQTKKTIDNNSTTLNTTLETTTQTTTLPFSELQIESMSNFMNDGKSVISGTWLYGISFAENGNGTLSKIKTDGTEQKRISSKSPGYINIYNGWIYYVGGCFGNEYSATITKIRISGEDEKNLATIKGEYKYFSYLFLYNNQLYFAELDEENMSSITGKYYRMDLDGSNKTLILNKAVYYPYIINDKIYYQDDSDNCKIHVCNIDGSNDKVFIDEWVYQFIFDGTSFYYVTYEDKTLSKETINNDTDSKLKRIVKCCDINGKNNKVFIDFTNIGEISMNKSAMFYSDISDDRRLYSYNLTDKSINLISNDNHIGCITLLGNLLSYYDYDEKSEYVDNIYYCNIDGTNKSEIFKHENV